ncbi:MAG: type I DNA topoisomerase [Myxococcales bacterium]|nr:type I DNA topoisomerase [Myxococcales bacterium]
MKTLVVVESPNKIAKISKCLGPSFTVVATIGHFRDLPERDLGVDVASFALKYETLPGKEGVLAKLREAARGASEVLLGTDADREGEAIAWHVAQVLGLSSPRRIRFQELTPAALKKAVAAAGPLDNNLVDAQQARRVLDRLVGYQVSPLLSVFGPQHSAGRVQSAALHLVVEREKAREAFKPEAYWTVTANYAAGFSAIAALKDSKGAWAAARFRQQADADLALSRARAAKHRVEALETKPTERAPRPPFTTATLQQAASAQLGMKPAETMAVAQSLFEKGAISYHRTDSVSLSAEAIAMARAFLARDYPEALPAEPVKYRNADSAQEAHEAIRPTAMQLEADVHLDEREEQLFSLINRRFLACQCRPARLDVTTVRTVAADVRFLARGTVVRFESFLRYAAEDETTAAAQHEGTAEDEAALPPLKLEQELAVASIAAKGDKTKPQPRFTQATLIRELQRTGIGRPSTYAATVTLLFERRYLLEEKKAVAPTPRGRLVDGALSAAFPDVVATEYTARLEAQLDEVAAGKLRWKAALGTWHVGFAKQLAEASGVLQRFAREHVTLVDAVGEASKSTGKPCPKCTKELILRQGSKGAFISCSGWPACDYRADPSARPSALKCPTCSSPMTEQDGKFGRYARCSVSGCTGRVDQSVTTQEECPRCHAPLKDKGAFLGCSNYPTCNFTVDAKALAHARKTGALCPKCGRLMVQRKGAKGPFLACIGYPECRHTAEAPTKAKKAVSRA